MAAPTAREIDTSFRRSLRIGLGWLCVALLSLIAAYRFARGQTGAAWLDAGWAVALLPVLVWMRRARSTEVAGAFMAVVGVACSIAKVHLLQMAGVAEQPWRNVVVHVDAILQ